MPVAFMMRRRFFTIIALAAGIEGAQAEEQFAILYRSDLVVIGNALNARLSIGFDGIVPVWVIRGRLFVEDVLQGNAQLQGTTIEYNYPWPAGGFLTPPWRIEERIGGQKLWFLRAVSGRWVTSGLGYDPGCRPRGDEAAFRAHIQQNEDRLRRLQQSRASRAGNK